MNTFNLNLDLDKTSGIIQWVTLRQGDKNGTQLRATIYDHGTPVTGSYTARFSLRHPGTGDTYYRETATYNNGVATVTVDEQYAATVTGITAGYFELLQGSTVITSTADFGVRILASATDGAVPGEVYDSAIEDALAELDEATGHINQMVVDATEEYLNAHPELTTTVEDNSLTDAKLIQQGGILSRVDRLMYRLDNLLTATPAEAESVTVTDAAKTPLAGLALYGKSTQDGTPTPSSPVAIESVTPNLWRETVHSIGASWTSTVSITKTGYNRYTVNGTSTGTHWLWGGGSSTDDRLFVTLPAGTYTAVLGGSDAGMFTISARGKVNGSLVALSNTGNPNTFTIEQETPVEVVIVTLANRTFNNADVSIQLFEGSSAAAPAFMPYGCAGLWARGRNLLPSGTTKTISGITYTVNADGSVNASGTASARSDFQFVTSLPLAAGTYTLSGAPQGGASKWNLRLDLMSNNSNVALTEGNPTTFTLTEETSVYADIRVYSGQTVNITFRPQLELGSTATAYQSYVESVTPIPLDGHTLRSLPDGTRDEVTVDERGHVVLVQRVGVVTPSSSDITNTISYTQTNTIVVATSMTYVTGELQGVDSNTVTDSAYMSNRFVGANYNHFRNNDTPACSLPNGGRQVAYRIPTSIASTLQEAQTWLASNPVTVLYKLATPIVTDLGTIDPVPLVGPDMTAQAVPTAPFALTYERDLNVTLARLEAAIADAATA